MLQQSESITVRGGPSNLSDEYLIRENLLEVYDWHTTYSTNGLILPSFSFETFTITNLGGAERISAQIKQFRNSTKNPTVTVHGGDAVTGTLFYTLFGPAADAAYMNEVGFDAMVAGNHEFDDGDSNLAEFARLLNATILSYNCKITVMNF